jgi:SHS2 domain-containing protein
MSSSSRSIEHVGEWRVEIFGDNLEDVFHEMARVIAREAGPGSDSHGPWEDLEIHARDREGLLVDYANELIGRSEAQSRSYDELRDLVVTDEPQPFLSARVRGREVMAWRSPLKAATYHGAELLREGRGWRANILFDV